jgi:hypothetical protein
MATIDKLDISVYNLYAMRTRMIEQINEEYHLEAASSIPPQTHVMNTYAKLSELDLLLGIVAYNTPWAYFFPPKLFHVKRRSPFTFSRVIPSLMSTEEGSEEYNNLFSVPCETPEEEKERSALAACFKEISKLNNWLSFIVGRVGQFLQG